MAVREILQSLTIIGKASTLRIAYLYMLWPKWTTSCLRGDSCEKRPECHDIQRVQLSCGLLQHLCCLLGSKRICKRQDPVPVHKLPGCLVREGGQPRAL